MEGGHTTFTVVVVTPERKSVSELDKGIGISACLWFEEEGCQ